MFLLYKSINILPESDVFQHYDITQIVVLKLILQCILQVWPRYYDNKASLQKYKDENSIAI